jgi:very-short-patch-repair endonuclease
MRAASTSKHQFGLLPSEWPELDAPVSSDGRKHSSPEELFKAQCRSFRLPPVAPQLRFAKSIGRQWRFDFAFPDYKLAVEIEGLVVMRLAGELVVRGRHASIKGIKEDMQKYNTAALLGWTVLRFEQNDVKSERAINMTQRVLASRGWKGFAT